VNAVSVMGVVLSVARHLMEQTLVTLEQEIIKVAMGEMTTFLPSVHQVTFVEAPSSRKRQCPMVADANLRPIRLALITRIGLRRKRSVSSVPPMTYQLANVIPAKTAFQHVRTRILTA